MKRARIAWKAWVTGALALTLPLAAGTASATEARSEEVSATGHGLASAAPTALATGVKRLVPRLVAMAAAAQADAAWTTSLTGLLPDTEEAIRAVWAGRHVPVFVADGQLTPAGEVAARWLARAEHHGADRATEKARRVAELRGTPMKEEPRVALASLELSAEQLVDAWRGASGAERRLLETARRLGQQGPMRTAIEALALHLAETSRARAELELNLAEGLALLATEVRPRPRLTAVHQDDDGYYASPDVLWKGQPAPAPTEAEVREMLAAAEAGPEALEAWLTKQAPRLPEYHALVDASERYAALCAAGGWEALPVPTVKRGRAWTDEEAITALQRRLAVEGFWKGETTGAFDDATVEALRKYREARHLEALETFEEGVAADLNIPCEARLATLRLNVRRWRHSARQDEATYVMVNLPGFRARFIADGQVRMTKRVVVGSGHSYWDAERKRRIFRNATPILHDAISQVVVNPTWTLPNRVIRNEIKPKVAKDPAYLEKNRYVVKQGASGQEVYVQLPGPGNALGTVKMLFPNSESVYMHDTNKPGFFAFPRRDFSHGCVRVHEAMEFAHVLLDHAGVQAGDDAPSLSRLKSIARNDSERSYWYPVAKPIPVFLEYYTATVDDDGTVLFHPDIYEYDKATLAAAAPGQR